MKKFSIFSLILIFVGILTCISSAYLISSAILSTNLLQSNSAIFEKQNVYCISMSKSQSENDLKSQITSLQTQNGAGYVLKQDDFYYLIASVYENSNDAEKVKTNLQNNGITCEILKIELEQTKIKGNFSTEEKNILTNCLSADFVAFKNLYDVAISLDTSVFDKTRAKLQCNNIFSNHIATKTNFQTFFKENLTDESFKYLQEQLSQTEEYLSSLVSENYENIYQTFSSLIKQTYCKILFE